MLVKQLLMVAEEVVDFVRVVLRVPNSEYGYEYEYEDSLVNSLELSTNTILCIHTRYLYNISTTIVSLMLDTRYNLSYCLLH